ncbi:hypothetical protein SDC9_178577 [bioreactor metagenome]|uniref:Uncharacterized protein n=1 Tax=bioreactor metagenome TaxID=1076179 RepID=A0A645H5I8_9ZZZZ
MRITDHQGVQNPGMNRTVHAFALQLFTDFLRIGPLHPEPERRTPLHAHPEGLVDRKGNLFPRPLRQDTLPAGNGPAAAGEGKKCIQTFQGRIQQKQG